MKPETIERRLIEYIRIHGGIATPLGKLEFTKSNRIGQGGNGVVYLATINEKEIAIKATPHKWQDLHRRTCIL